MSYFWSWPPQTAVNFENDVSQARDLLAGERNFLVGVRTSFVVVVAALSVLYQQQPDARRWFDWALTGVLLFLSLGFPIAALVDYSLRFDAYFRDVARVHTSTWLLAFVVVLAVCDVLIAVRAA